MEESKEHFYDIFSKKNVQIDESQFEQEKRKFLEKNPHLKDIPTLKNIEALYEEYYQKYYIFYNLLSIYLFRELHRKNYKNKNWNENEQKILIFMVIFHSCSTKKNYENFVKI